MIKSTKSLFHWSAISQDIPSRSPESVQLADDHDTSLAAAGQIRKLWRGEPWVLCRGDAERARTAVARTLRYAVELTVIPTQETFQGKIDIDTGSGAYVSVSIGGDARVTTSPAPGGGPPGYTTQAGVISPGKSTLLVWQLGSARVASTDPNARVIVYPLAYTLNTWNHYTINVSNALLDIPVADRPVDYNGLTYIKMAAASNNGTVDDRVIRPLDPEGGMGLEPTV